MIYLSPAQLLFLHSRLLDELGGEAEPADVGKLTKAVKALREEFFGRPVDRYREEKAAALLHAIIRLRPVKAHSQVLALAAALLFLERNGTVVECSTTEAVTLLDAICQGGSSVRDTGRWLRAHGARHTGG